jgi:hypothetical protein
MAPLLEFDEEVRSPVNTYVPGAVMLKGNEVMGILLVIAAVSTLWPIKVPFVIRPNAAIKSVFLKPGIVIFMVLGIVNRITIFGYRASLP